MKKKSTQNHQASILHAQRGFGILEVLVATALLTILSVGTMTLLESTQKAQRGVQAKDEFRDVIAEMRSHLNNRAACLNSFGGQNVTGSISSNSIKDASNVNKFVVGAATSSNMLKFSKFTIDGWTADASSPNQGTAKLNVNVSKTSNAGGTQELHQTIAVRLKTDAANKITDCFSLGTVSEGAWQLDPSNANNILFGAGNVGVGAITPATALDVDGALSARGLASAPALSPAGQGRIYFDSIAGKMKISENGGAYADLGGAGLWKNDGPNPKSAYYNGGNVGIGTDNPSSKFTVVADSPAVGRLSFGDAGADLAFDGGTDGYFLIVNQGPSSGYTQFNYVDALGSTQPILSMTNTGQVSIGPVMSRSSVFEVRPPPAASGGAAAGITMESQSGSIGGTGGNITMLLGGGNLNVGSSGTFNVQNRWVATAPTTLQSNSLVGMAVNGKLAASSNMVSTNSANPQPTQLAIGVEAKTSLMFTSGNDFGQAIGLHADSSGMSWGDPLSASPGKMIGVYGTVGYAGTSMQINEAYAGSFSVVPNPSSTIMNAYGVFVGTVAGKNKWSLYASDQTAPSYFAGKVGFGTTQPTESLHIVGNLRVQGATDCTLGNGAGGTMCSSDKRLKDNVREIQDASRKILSLRGVDFDWNEKSQSPGVHAMGVIAQEVEKVFPTAVVEDPSSGFKKVDYAVLVAPLIQAFKNLNQKLVEVFGLVEKNQREVASVSAVVVELKGENQILKIKLSEVEKQNSDLKVYLCSKDPNVTFCR